MHALVTRLRFDGPEAAEAELAELEEQAESIGGSPGFGALYGIRSGTNEVVVVRIFETNEGLGRSLAGPLRPDLAEHLGSRPCA